MSTVELVYHLMEIGAPPWRIELAGRAVLSKVMLTCPAGETYEAIKVLQESPLSPEACRVMTAFPGAGCAVDTKIFNDRFYVVTMQNTERDMGDGCYTGGDPNADFYRERAAECMAIAAAKCNKFRCDFRVVRK